MARFTYMLNSFRSGELGPKTHARTDVSQYANGLDTLENFLPYKTGGIGRRPGFYKKSEKSIGPGNINGVVQRGKNYNIVFELEDAGVYSMNLGYFLPAALRTWDITNVEAIGTPKYPVSATIPGGLSAGAVAALDKIPNQDLSGLTTVQLKNCVIVVDKSSKMEPLILSPFLSGGDITFSLRSWTEGGVATSGPFITDNHWSTLPLIFRTPFEDANIGFTELTPSGTSGAITISSDTPLFEAGHVGALFIIDNSSSSNPESLSVVITAVTDSQNVNAKVLAATAGYAAGATNYWFESSWSDLRGYPRCVEVHNGRLLFGGSSQYPDTIWGSVPFFFGQFNRNLQFGTITKGTSAEGIGEYSRDAGQLLGGVAFNLASNRGIESVEWMKSSRSLFIGTSNREIIASISPANVSFSTESNNGSRNSNAVAGFNSVYFIGRDGRSIYESTYSEENGGYQTRDLTNLNKEILQKDIIKRDDRYIQLEWNNSYKTLFCRTEKGKIKAITIEKSVEVAAISNIIMPDSFITDIKTIIDPRNGFEFLLASAYNTTTSTASEFNLILLDYFEGDAAFANNNLAEFSNFCCYVDYAKAVLTAFTATASISIGSEYNGMTLDFLCENAAGDLVVYQGITVASGTATLPASVVKYVAGVGYTSKLKTLTLEVGPNNTFNSQGDIIRIDRATVKLFKSWVGKYGTDETLYDFEKLGLTGSYTGEERVDVPIGPGTENKITIETDQPLPLNILGMVLRGNNNP